ETAQHPNRSPCTCATPRTETRPCCAQYRRESPGGTTYTAPATRSAVECQSPRQKTNARGTPDARYENRKLHIDEPLWRPHKRNKTATQARSTPPAGSKAKPKWVRDPHRGGHHSNGHEPAA